MTDVLIGLIIVGSGALVAAPILVLKWLVWKQDKLRAEKQRLQWMLDFRERGSPRFSTRSLDVVGGTPHERAAVNRYLEGHRYADQFIPPPPPPPPGRVVRDSMFPRFAPLDEATDAPARRLRRRTP